MAGLLQKNLHRTLKYIVTASTQPQIKFQVESDKLISWTTTQPTHSTQPPTTLKLLRHFQTT
jgi:hypothetical protein